MFHTWAVYAMVPLRYTEPSVLRISPKMAARREDFPLPTCRERKRPKMGGGTVRLWREAG